MSKTKILYIEDEVFLAQIVKETLDRNGYEILHLVDGIKLFQNLEEFKPDICVFDIMLPFKSGYELSQEVRKYGNTVPILFLSAKSQTADLVTGFESGGNDYIKKPFSMEELVVRIENLLLLTRGKKNESKTGVEIKLGEHSFFSPIKQLLSIKGKSIQLSYKETQILQLLCNHINGTTERKEILLKVWSDDSYFNSRNLDVYMRKIRSYISLDNQLKILTLKGVGYHFIVEKHNY